MRGKVLIEAARVEWPRERRSAILMAGDQITGAELNSVSEQRSRTPLMNCSRRERKNAVIHKG